MSSVRSSYEVGLDFLQFLGQRISKTDRKELQDIYNLEFKRDGREEPTFPQVIRALSCFKRARSSHGKIFFHWKPKMRVYYCDQWKSFAQQNSNPSAPDSDPASSSSPRPTIKPVLTPKKKLASEILNKPAAVLT